MNELLQKHGCSNVFSVPEGLRELSSDITREVLRWQPPKILDFIAKYLSALLITREHGIMAVKILDDLCDCKPSVSEHLLQIGLKRPEVDVLANIIKTEVEKHEPLLGKEKVKETAILKKILNVVPLDEEMSARVCQIARNAYRDYWYRKTALKKGMKMEPEEAWEKAAEHTLEIYKKTKPSLTELHRATEKIQAAYRGYHVRKNVLRHLMPEQKKKKKPDRKVELTGPPLDVASSREIDLGPVVNIKIKKDNVSGMFDSEAGEKLGLKYDPMKTITHKDDDDYLLEKKSTKSIQIASFVETPKGTKFKMLDAALSKASPIPKAVLDLDVGEEKFKDYGTPTTKEPPRITFALAPPEVIMDSTSEDQMDAQEVPEIPEIDSESREPMVIPPVEFEIPEELQVDDGSSKLSSGHQSARSTDIEDAAIDCAAFDYDRMVEAVIEDAGIVETGIDDALIEVDENELST